MENQNPNNGNTAISIFDVLKDFAENAAITEYQGVQVRMQIVLVTPEIAAGLLRTQVRNRGLSRSRYMEYARRMKDGEWKLGEPWVFDEHGHMIQSQHRANAVVHSGVSVPAMIIQGVPTENQSVMDIGMNRGMRDIAAFEGITLNQYHVSIAKAMLLPWSANVNSIAPLHSPAYFLKFYRAHQEGIDAACKRYGERALMSSPVRAMIATAWDYENHAKLEAFLKIWDTAIATNEVERSVVMLRERYTALIGKISGGMVRHELSRKACTVIKAYIEDRPLQRIIGSASPWPSPIEKLKQIP